MQKTKKILSALLALVMVIGIMPAAAFASPCELEEHTHGEGCYTLTCELSEHSHTACDLSCDKVAHTHCYDDKCEIEAHKHTACDLSCDKEAHAHCYTFTCEKAEHKHNEECADEEVVYVAQIGTTQYETLQAAADVGGSIKLLADVAESVVVAKDVTLDLNGFDVISAGDAFEITAGTLTVNGEGVVAGGSTGVGSWTAIWANGGKAILNGGTYAVGGDSSTTDVTHQNDVIYTKNGGSVVINGGYFENDGTVWTLNENDANRGTIVVKGGTFENWDPANNVSEGPATNFVADGYISVKSGDNYVVREKVGAKLITNLEEVDFVVGEPAEFTFSTVANDDAGVMVVGLSDFNDPDALAKLEYYEPNTDAWYDLNGAFGGGNGFPMADATSKFRATFAKAGEFTFTSVMKTVDGDKILCSVEATAVVVEAEPDAPEVPEEPVTPDIDPDARCGKYEHKHTACDLSCKLYTHTHCHGDTCEIEEHKHTACDLSCDKEEHIHCYPATETPDEPELPEEPEQPEEPVIPELPKPEEVEGYELNCDKGAHKHTACDLSCPYDEHTHCFSDTCELEEHKHIACDLSCDKVEHVHCYTKIETELPEDPEEPEEPVETVEITEIAFEVAAPVDGEAISEMVDAVVTTPDGVIAVEDVFIIWGKNDTDDIQDADWELMLPEDIFEKGAYYAAVIAFDIPEGAVIADDCVATINGEEFMDVYVDAGNEEYAPSFNAIYVFDDLVDAETPDEPEVPVEPETPVVPDVDGYKTNCAKEEHKHTACDLSCDKEAHTHCFSDKCDKDHEHCYVKIEEEPEAPEYSIITGANGTWKDSATDGMTFASDAEFADFVSVKIDGVVVDAANYDAKEGSTVVTLKNAYLKTLKEGEHTLTIVSKDGEASTKFTIEHEHKLTKVEAKKETCVDKGNSEYYTCECGKWFKDDKAETEIVDKTSVEIKAAGHKAATEWSRDAKSHWHKCTVCKEAADEKVAHDFDKETGKICQTCKYDVDNPKTGSEAHITVMATLMTLSVVVMAGVAAYFVWDKKRKH